MHRLFTVLLLLVFAASKAQSPLYYPPLTGNVWATTSPLSLGWCPDKIDSLYDYLGSKNTKAFIVLKDGRIVLEKYFGTFGVDSVHMWASAGKTLTAFTTGIAQEEGLLNINNQTAQYLGAGWTSAPSAKEALITVRHQLTMTTGLNDNVSDPNCATPSCLQYLADAGTRWAYHTGAYTVLHDVVDSAAGPLSWRQFFNTRMTAKTGITGSWVKTSGYNDIFYSKPRSAARFGLLMLGRGIWAGDTILHDTAYFSAMTRPSQTLNPSYGYLTWLNGQNSYRLPGIQIAFAGPLFPDAPPDMFAALGKDDQKIYVAPAKGLVVVRMGDAADSSRQAASNFDNELWVKINAAICSPTAVITVANTPAGWHLFPQPAREKLHISGITITVKQLWLLDLSGKCIREIPVQNGEAAVNLQNLAPGNYIVSDGRSGRLFENL